MEVQALYSTRDREEGQDDEEPPPEKFLKTDDTDDFGDFDDHVDTLVDMLKMKNNSAKPKNQPIFVKANAERSGGRSLRNRMTEEEEDLKLLKIQKNLEKEEETREGKIRLFSSSPPFIKNGEMRDYQVRGLNWMIGLYAQNINGILADEMGLGKTLQTISVIGYMKHMLKITGPHIVIVPKSTLHNWGVEFKRWCPDIRTISLIGDKEERAALISEEITPRKKLSWDVLLTTFDVCWIEITALKKFNWRYLVLDEAHRIKNENSKLSMTVRMLRVESRLLLTGTPLQNNLHELWALLNFLMPDKFDDAETFNSQFNEKNCLENETLVDKLHSILKPYMLRRIKADVEKTLLPKKETMFFLKLTRMQVEWYKKILMDDVTILNPGTMKMERTRINNTVMHLRKVCNHPYLFKGAEEGPPFYTDFRLVQNSGKLLFLDKLLPRLRAEGSRVLLFCTMTRCMDIIDDYLFWKGYKYCRLDGSTNHEVRQKLMDDFNAPNSEYFMFMLSTRAGGLGINLATADIVILYDTDWNPQVDLQAIDRAHRIGQKKQVRVFRLIQENSMEERMVERAAVKLQLDRVVIQQGRLADGKTKRGGNAEMLDMIRHGAQKVLKMTDEDLTEEGLDTILEKGEKRTEELTKKLEKAGESQLKEFSFDNEYNYYSFEGEDFKGQKKEKKDEIIEDMWIDLPKRTCKDHFNPEMEMTKITKGIRATQRDDETDNMSLAKRYEKKRRGTVYSLKGKMRKLGHGRWLAVDKEMMMVYCTACEFEPRLKNEDAILKHVMSSKHIRQSRLSKVLEFLARYEDGDEWLDYDAEHDEVCCVVCENSWELEDEYAIKVHLNSLFHKMRVTTTESELNLDHIRNKKKIPPGLRDATSAAAGGYLETEPVWQDFVQDPRVPCIYGFDCFRMNFEHHEQYKHPPHRRANLPKPANNGWMVPIFVPKGGADNFNPGPSPAQPVMVKQSTQLSDGLVTELTNGWVKVKTLKKGGGSVGTYDMYYYSPEGKKFRSLAHIQRWSQEMGIRVDLQAFMTESQTGVSTGKPSDVVECFDLSSDSNSSSSSDSRPQNNTHTNPADVEIIDLDSNSSDAFSNINAFSESKPPLSFSGALKYI